MTGERPLGLSLLAWLLWFWAGAALLTLVLVGVGDGPVMLAGRALPRDQALAHILPVLVPMALAAGGAALALALDRHWARAAILLPFAIAAVGPVFTGAATDLRGLARSALGLAPIIVALVWYLFFNRRVVAHFRALRDRQAIGAGRGGTP